MAVIDYGAIVFKNGTLISTDMFPDMIDMVGWEDTDEDFWIKYPSDKQLPIQLKDNFMAYIGDSDYTVAFYKEQIRLVRRIDTHEFTLHHEYFNCTHYTWSKWSTDPSYSGNIGSLQVTKRNGYYVCKWKYKGDKYKVYFGYGVDLNYYKRWHMVNYYRSPGYLIKKKIRDIIYNIKYKN